MHKPLTAIIIFTLLLEVKGQTPAGLTEINKEDLLENVKVLTSAEFDGRLSGSEGYAKAAKFAANKFSKLGIRPAGDVEYFQYLNVEDNRILSPVIFNAIVGQDTIEYKIGKDFMLRGFTGSNKFTLPVVFCGYGISRPDLGYDDYANRNVKDKVVLVFKQNPNWKIDNQEWNNEYPREKSLVALRRGAKGILFVSPPNVEKPQPLIASVLH
jgi:hypothetical protein